MNPEGRRGFPKSIVGKTIGKYRVNKMHVSNIQNEINYEQYEVHIKKVEEKIFKNMMLNLRVGIRVNISKILELFGNVVPLWI